MTKTSTTSVIRYRDLFVGDFWRYFVRAVWLFFPSILFIFLGYAVFWKLTQGKDVMIIILENRKVFGLFLLALIFWVLITWYTSRLITMAKSFVDKEQHLMWSTLKIQGPRILGFSCITIVLLAFFQLPYPDAPQLSGGICNLLFWLSFSWYFLVYQFWTRVLHRKDEDGRKKIASWQKIRLGTYAILSAGTLVVVLNKWVWGLIALLLLYQVGFVAIILIRRNIIIVRKGIKGPASEEEIAEIESLPVLRKFIGLVSVKEDKRYFQAINIISFLALIVYFTTIFSVRFSTWIGSFPFLLLAFGVLLGLGNLIAMFSILLRFNFHILFITLAFLIGNISEPHYTRLVDKKDASIRFDKRQGLRDFFNTWVNDPERKKILSDTATHKYPVYFVMANGGASRSGYWAASVLSKLEDETKGAFSKHLFCLSGASGGSVGNAAFFSILKAKENLKKTDPSATPCLNATKGYLKSDFLTYTLARTLGPDLFRNLVTLYNVNDRASALSHALEKSAGKSAFLNDSLGIGFSTFMTQEGSSYHLPIIFINTTRMQDGNPGIVSNIKITDDVFNNRIDVLGLLGEKKDMKLSTGVVLGASFPYLSPAGRIDYHPCDTCATEPNYFVDGGYFDNSGAGPVYESIFAINQLLEENEYAFLKDKLDFHVLHIINDPLTPAKITKVNPFINDLAAPVKTLIGAYGTQTSVNDLRLNKYIRGLYNDNDHYRYLSLYKEKDSMNYTMSWVISRYVLNAMDRRLEEHPGMGMLIATMKQQLQ
ncbi:MAG: hypothetical protein GC171_02080 [Terrimonas sp.]|nr:hypothetical protein [Terrimonas sp.]